MMSCDDARRRMARAAEAAADPGLDAHLAVCPACRTALEEQRTVALILRARPPAPARADFGARVRARLDAGEAPGVLDLANWRIWGGALAPIGAGLTLAAWLGIGIDPAARTPSEGESLAAWAQPAADSDAAVFLQPDASADLLLESLLTDVVPPVAGEGDVR